MKINRALSIVLVALMLVAMLPTFAFAAGTGTVTVSGNSTFISAPASAISQFSYAVYTATYNNGEEIDEEPTAFSWEVTKDGVAATDVWCDDGQFIVKSGAAGTYNIAATHIESGVKSDVFPVIVTAATVYDWDNNKPAGYENVTLTEEDGNKYYKDNYFAFSTADYQLTSGQNVGVKTLNLRFKVPKGVTYTGGHYNIVADGTGNVKGPITAYYHANHVTDPDKFMLTVRGGVWDSLCDVSGNTIFLDYDKWYELCVVFDVPAAASAVPNVTGLWLENEYCMTKSGNSGTPSDIRDIYDNTVNSLRFFPNCDDVVMYTGAPYFPVPEIKETQTIYIPQAAGVKNYVQLSASSIVGSDGITWSIPETPGVSIDANTGLVTVTNEATAGTVTVTVNQYGGTGEADLVLKVISEDFEADGSHGNLGSATGNPWAYSDVTSEANGNQYAVYRSTETSGYIGRYFTANKIKEETIDASSITADGSIVMEFKFKRLEGSGSRIKVDGIQENSIGLGSHGDWATAKIVYNNAKNEEGNCTLTAFVNGELIYYNHECDTTGDPSRIQFQTDAIDDFKVYGADFAAPEAYDVTLSDTAPGSELALSYKYFNEGSVAENGTEIVWSYADSENSENWTALTAFNNKTAIDAETTATLKGKYVKAVVTPKTVNPYTNEIVAGASAEAVALIDDVVLSTECTVDGNSFNIDSDSLTAGKTLSYTFSATQIQEDAETYMVVTATYTADGKELLAADAKDLTTEKGDAKSVTVSATKAEDTIIKVFVFKKADISPVIYNPVK